MGTRPPTYRQLVKARAGPPLPVFRLPGREGRGRAETGAQREADRIRSSNRWQRARAKKLAQDPLCEPCLVLDRITPATQVDHVVPLREDLERAYDPENLQSICKPCHDVKSGRERRNG